MLSSAYFSLHLGRRREHGINIVIGAGADMGVGVDGGVDGGRGSGRSRSIGGSVGAGRG